MPVIVAVQEVVAGGSRVQGWPRPHRKFQASLGYVARFYLERKKKITHTKKKT